MKFSCRVAGVLLLILSLLLLPGQRDGARSRIKTIHPTFTTMDVPGAGVTAVYGINSAGDMVGTFGTDVNDPHKRGFLSRDGRFIHVDYPDAHETFVYGINDAGLIVGQAELQGGYVSVGFTYDGIKFTRFHDGKNSVTVPYGINNSGNIVGGAGTLYTTKGFEEGNSHFRTINFPGNNVYAFATGINNFGQIVGWTDYDAYLYDQGVFQNVDIPDAYQTEAWGINNNGLVVGWYFLGGTDYGFALLNGKYLSFSYPGAYTFAQGVNTSGQIVGTYTFNSDTYHGFVTSPITTVDFE